MRKWNVCNVSYFVYFVYFSGLITIHSYHRTIILIIGLCFIEVILVRFWPKNAYFGAESSVRFKVMSNVDHEIRIKNLAACNVPRPLAGILWSGTYLKRTTMFCPAVNNFWFMSYKQTYIKRTPVESGKQFWTLFVVVCFR